jgi:hypothetical protein
MYAIDAVLDLYFPVEDKDELQGMADRFSERWGQGEMNGTVLAIDGACAYVCAFKGVDWRMLAVKSVPRGAIWSWWRR